MEWFENITDEFCEEQVMEERISVESIERWFYMELTE